MKTLFSSPSPTSFLSKEELSTAHIGLYIVETATERELLRHNEGLFFTPASLQKIPLSAVAISLLGKDYCFKTELFQKPHQEGLYIKGGGDPTLTHDLFTHWKELLRQKGIDPTEGKITLDTSSFETTLASPYWEFEDLGNYFGAGACGLSLNSNLFRITLAPGKTLGDLATVLNIEPEIPNLHYINEVTTGPSGSGDQMYVFGSEYNSLKYFRGTIPIDLPTLVVKAAMPDPAEYAAHLLKMIFSPKEGIEILREKGSFSSLTILDTHYSAPLEKLLKVVNHESNNLYAEHIFKKIGDGCGKEASLVMESTLTSWGITSHVKDGCGLARRNSLSPKGMVNLLQRLAHDPNFFPVYDSISEELLDPYLEEFPLLHNITFTTKTGKMSQVCNLAGYFTLPNGKQYTFAFFCNHHIGTNKEVMQEYLHILSQFISNLDS